MNPLKAARLRAGMTQDELADESGVSQSFISKLEAKPAVPRSVSIDTVLALAAALKVEPKAFVAKKKAA